MLGTLNEDQLPFLIISPSIRLRMRNVSDKRFREYKITHLIFSKFFLRKSCCLLDNVEKIL